jgi:regulatory protein
MPAVEQAVDNAGTEIEAAAVQMLAMREHSRFELQRKLARRFGRNAPVEHVLDDLAGRNLLSDHRFVETYIDQRSRKGFGPLRIRAELAERGISSALVAELLDESALDWVDRLLEVAERKFGGKQAADRRELARRARFLQQRGFPTSLIGRYLDENNPR